MTPKQSTTQQDSRSAGLQKVLKIAFGIGATLGVLFLAGYLLEFFSRTGPQAPPLSDALPPAVQPPPALSGRLPAEANEPDLQEPSFQKNRPVRQRARRDPPAPPPARPAAPAGSAPGPAPAAPQAGPVIYTVQLGSFQKSEGARSFSEALAAKGYEPYITRVAFPGKGTLYRVRIGRFEDMQAAKALAAEIEKREKLSALITSK